MAERGAGDGGGPDGADGGGPDGADEAQGRDAPYPSPSRPLPLSPTPSPSPDGADEAQGRDALHVGQAQGGQADRDHDQVEHAPAPPPLRWGQGALGFGRAVGGEGRRGEGRAGGGVRTRGR